MDSFLNRIFLHHGQSGIINENIPGVIIHDTNKESFDKQNERVKNFYVKSIEGRFKISLEQFLFITSFEKKEKIAAELKEKFRITKKEAEKIAESYV